MPSRKVRVDRDGRFEIDGHPYTLRRSSHVLTRGEYEVWDEAPDMTIPHVTLASPGPGPGRPVATAPTYAEARELIDAAAEGGGFR